MVADAARFRVRWTIENECRFSNVSVHALGAEEKENAGTTQKGVSSLPTLVVCACCGHVVQPFWSKLLLFFFGFVAC